VSWVSAAFDTPVGKRRSGREYAGHGRDIDDRAARTAQAWGGRARARKGALDVHRHDAVPHSSPIASRSDNGIIPIPAELECEVRRRPDQARINRSAFDSGGVMSRADGFRFGRAALAQIYGEDGHRADGQELGLPVLKRPLPKVWARQVLGPGDCALLVVKPLAVVGGQAGYRLGEPGADPDGGHHPQQRVLVQSPPKATDFGPARRIALGVLADLLVFV
jgi:hypothetical protein